jgi:hypothetical protein
MHEYKTIPFEVTSLDATGRTVEGYAAVFGNIDAVGDIIHPGAFRKTLAERGPQVKFLWQHEPREPLGRIMEAREDQRGLFIKAVVSDTARGRDALALLRDGAIEGLSIGYDAVKGGTDYESRAARTIRNLREIKLYECSLVTLPANEEAGVTALKGVEPTETKPEPDVTENTIRVRVADPDDFEDGSFRTITISRDQGIQAVVARKPGADSTTVQTYIFDKDKWSVDEAEKWVADHEKAWVVEIETKAGRVISRASHAKIKAAMEALTELLTTAGLLEAIEEAEDDAPAEKQQAAEYIEPEDDEAGPVEPPTSESLLKLIEIEEAELQLLEV